VKERQVRVDNLAANSEPILKLHNKIPLIIKIYFSHTNTSGMVRIFLKMIPSLILASWKENHLFAVIKTKNVCRFLPAVKSPDGLTTKIILLLVLGEGGGRNSCTGRHCFIRDSSLMK
jgi:hypothetical protein